MVLEKSHMFLENPLFSIKKKILHGHISQLRYQFLEAMVHNSGLGIPFLGTGRWAKGPKDTLTLRKKLISTNKTL